MLDEQIKTLKNLEKCKEISPDGFYTIENIIAMKQVEALDNMLDSLESNLSAIRRLLEDIDSNTNDFS